MQTRPLFPREAVGNPPTRTSIPPTQQKGQQNRLSKFIYKAGSTKNTRLSEKILVTSGEKDGNIHSGGWVGFLPSAYGKGVSDSLRVDTLVVVVVVVGVDVGRSPLGRTGDHVDDTLKTQSIPCARSVLPVAS